MYESMEENDGLDDVRFQHQGKDGAIGRCNKNGVTYDTTRQLGLRRRKQRKVHQLNFHSYP